MKTISKITALVLILFLFTASNSNAQRDRAVLKERHSNRKVVVVDNRHHMFRKAAVYHPIWAPRASFRNRWVYFPRYNLYWDNFRNVYVIRTGTVWIASTSIPKEVEKADLSNERKIELSKDNDSQNSIQDDNAKHQNEYKVN